MQNNQLARDFDVVEPEVTSFKVSHGMMKNYNYLVFDREDRIGVIVDPAWEMEKIDRVIVESRVRLAGVLITHAHPDHINLAKPVAEKYDCPIWMSREEVAESGFAAQRLRYAGTPWRIGRMLIHPLFTPGHTAGCVCYLIGNNLFTGDVLFAEGCGLCRDVAAAHQMYHSLEYLKSTLDPTTRIYPGHSFSKEPGQLFSGVLKENMYLQFTDKESFASFRLRSGQSRQRLFGFR